MNTATWVQILDVAVCISHSAHILKKAWLQLFSSQLWVNRREDEAFSTINGNQSKRRKTEFKPVNSGKNWPSVSFCSYGRVGKYIYVYGNFFIYNLFPFLFGEVMNNFRFLKSSYKYAFQTSNDLNATGNYLIKD